MTPILVWIGRFTHQSGYGVATRGYYRAIRAAGLPCVLIDSVDHKIVGPALGVEIDFKEGNDELKLTLPDGRPAVVVFHETFEAAERLKVSGNCRKILLTIFEDDEILARWAELPWLYDEVWGATDFNLAALREFGFPETRLHKLPHVAEALFADDDIAPLDMSDYNSTVFLSIISNFNRKDIADLVRCYCEEFPRDDDVSLIIKLPSSTTEEQLQEFGFRGQGNVFSFDDPNLPHIVFMIGHLSQERMAAIYKSVRAHISTERAKGWDLPSMEAMISGCEAVSVAWGANLEFMTDANARLIPVLDSRSIVNEINMNGVLYGLSDWPIIDSTACKAILRDLYETPYKAARRKKAQADIAKHYNPSAIGKILSDKLETYQSYQFESRKTGKVELRKKKMSAKLRGKIIPFESLSNSVPFTNSPDDFGGDTDAWVAARRELFKHGHGMVLPSAAEVEKLAALKNKFYGQRIFIVGNGPSLNKMDLTLMKNDYSFGANRIYLMYDRVDWRPSFFTALDWVVTPDNYKEIERQSRESQYRFFPQRFAGLFDTNEDTYWYESVSAGGSLKDKFATDVSQGMVGGGTVLTAAMQMAFHMGFREFYMLGVDLSYSIPKSVIQSGGDRFGTGIQINLQSTKDDDANHFDSRYFGAGSKWHDPNTDEMYRGFIAARDMIEYHGGTVRNATVGGNLNDIERVDYNSLF